MSNGGSHRRTRTVAVALGIAVSALVLSGCTVNEIVFLDLPEPISDQAMITENLWRGAWIAAWGVGLLTWGLMIWAAIVYRRRHRDDVPEQTQYNLPIEIMYTVVPLVMIMGMFWFTARDQSEILALRDDQDLTVNVVGFRWNWAFNYMDQGAYAVGSPTEPAVLVLPVDEKVRFQLTSPDVIHSFWVPDFLFKMDIIPGKTNQFELTPNKVGTYPGRCAELCGVDHARMLFTLKVVDKAEFDTYIAGLKAKGQSGLLKTDMTTNHGQMPDERTT